MGNRSPLRYIWYGRVCVIFLIRTGRITRSFAAVCLICVRAHQVLRFDKVSLRVFYLFQR